MGKFNVGQYQIELDRIRPRGYTDTMKRIILLLGMVALLQGCARWSSEEFVNVTTGLSQGLQDAQTQHTTESETRTHCFPNGSGGMICKSRTQ